MQAGVGLQVSAGNVLAARARALWISLSFAGLLELIIGQLAAPAVRGIVFMMPCQIVSQINKRAVVIVRNAG